MNSPTSSPRDAAIRAPWVTGLVTLIALIVAQWPAAIRALEYDRTLIVSGDWWRIVTGHFVHLSRSALWWNLLVLVPTGIWCERLNPMRARFVFGVAAVLIGTVLFTFEPDLGRFAGLSGIATAMLILLALLQLRASENDRWFWRSVLALVVLKIVAEAVTASSLLAHFPDPTTRAVPLSHLAGVAAAVGVNSFRRRRRGK